MQNRTLCFLTRGNPPEEVLLGFKKSGFGSGKYAGFGVGVEGMVPFWYKIEEIPLDCMWADAAYWLPLILKGKKIKATFVFNEDNETVDEYSLEDWLPE